MGVRRVLYVGNELMGLFDRDFQCNLRYQFNSVNPLRDTLDLYFFMSQSYTAKLISAENAFRALLADMKANDSQITDLVLSLGTFELYPEHFDAEVDANALLEFSEHYQALIAMFAENFESLQRVILVIPPVMSAQANKKLISENMSMMYRDVLTKEHPFQLVAIDLLNSMQNIQAAVNSDKTKLTDDASTFALRMVAEGMHLPIDTKKLLVVSGDQATNKIDKKSVDLTLPEHEVDLSHLNPVDLFRTNLMFAKPAVTETTAKSESKSFVSFKETANGIMALCGALGTIGAATVGIVALAGVIALSATGIGLVAAGLVVSLGLFAGGLALLHKRHPEKYGFAQLCNSPGAAFNYPSGYFWPMGGMTL